MPEYFRAGKPCMCVKGGPWGESGDVFDYYGPSKHQQVTVRHIIEHEGKLLLSFEEYARMTETGGYYCYTARNFRPMDDCNFGGFRLDVYADEQDRLMKPGGVGA